MHDELKALVTKLYQEHGVTVTPTYPRILVRLLPKEQVSKGGIVLTDHQQNKPVHEGFVLVTYPGFFRDKYVKDPLTEEREMIESTWIESDLKPGDHVLFPFMAQGIIPVWPLDGGSGEYRLVPEEQCLVKLTYTTKPLVQDLTDEFLSLAGAEKDPSLARDNVEDFLQRFEVVRKTQPSMTVSGR